MVLKYILVFKNDISANKNIAKSLASILLETGFSIRITDVKTHSIECVGMDSGDTRNALIYKFCNDNKLTVEAADTSNTTGDTYFFLGEVLDSGLRQAGINKVKGMF